MAKNGETKVIDKGFNTSRKNIDAIATSFVDVGILKGVSDFVGPPKPGKRLTQAEIALVNEFGSRNGKIPERSFIRSTFDEKRKKYIRVLKELLSDTLIGIKTVEGALDLFGVRVAGDIKRKITSIRVPENAPLTIAKKGFDNPLIRTGAMRARIKHKVRKL